ncbi:MAG: hypothetical protein Q4D90_01305 [bacterium]|nr:hypothetical protein [bacterium]
MKEEEDIWEQQRRYLDGLKRYSERGIPIYIDGEESSADQWKKLFQVKEGDGFYMGDYIDQDGVLKEIRFDKVYCQKESRPKRTRN